MVLLLWIICVILIIFVLCLSCFRVFSLLPFGHLLLALVCDVCVFVTFPCGILGQVWYFIASIPDLCHLSYFNWATSDENLSLVFATLNDSNQTAQLQRLFSASF